jgi:hypothetical protein
LNDLSLLTPDSVHELSDDELRDMLAQMTKLSSEDRKENQLRFYVPVSEAAAQAFESDARVLGFGGGNRSSKTESLLTLLVACVTGVFPDSMKHTAARRFRGPIKTRIICDSLTTVLMPVIMPKLQWWKWSGADQPGGERGHWGWIPPYCLIDRSWDKSWTEKYKTLRVLCRDPAQPDIVLGESTIHFMSYDQEEGRGTDFHIILHDEPPPLHIWRESEARAMGVGGRLLLAMTWPDDPSISVDWLFDEVYEPGIDPNNTDIAWFNLRTVDNRNVDQNAVAKQAEKWSEETKAVRLEGQSLRFSNRIHPLFTDRTMHWCYHCQKQSNVESNPEAIGETDTLLCTSCRGTDVGTFNHVKEFSASPMWPVIFVLDPHPRKAHCGMWVAVDPQDDLWQVAEIECDGDPTDMRKEMDEIEEKQELDVVQHWMDPNMGASSSSSRRNVSWQDAFVDAEIPCELADDSAVGRKSVNEYLKPDPHTRQPRIHVHPRCRRTIFQIQRFVWDEYKRSAEKDQKQTPKPKNDDFPALWRYLMNTNPTFIGLRGLQQVYHRPGVRRRGY